MPLLPVRLHLHDHDHHHREVAGRLLPLLLPGHLHNLHINILLGLLLHQTKVKNSTNIFVKYLHNIIIAKQILFAESVLLQSNYCKHPGDRAKDKKLIFPNSYLTGTGWKNENLHSTI